MIITEDFTLLAIENIEWFKHHKYLSDEDMLKLGLIDPCDLWWVEMLRRRKE